MRLRHTGFVLLLAVVLPGHAADQMVFGSFKTPENANNWAARVAQQVGMEIAVAVISKNGGTWYRVASSALDETDYADLERRANVNGIRYWRLREGLDEVPMPGVAEKALPPVRIIGVAGPGAAGATMAVDARPVSSSMDIDLGLQARTFSENGLDGQSRFQPSFSASLDYYRSWDQERQSLTFSPFLRLDAEDDERTHFDLRELYWSRVGNDWDLHLGVKQVFWGVTEFKHLVDVVNQTDLVENIDSEDKLGQPMAHLSVIRDWGIIDFYLLAGFRERTFPGSDGRLRLSVPIDNHRASYESGAGQHRIDGAVRWSHRVGPVEFGISHFSGTSRDPQLVPAVTSSGSLVLRPHYPVIDQTGLDAQAILGDWAWKIEAISTSGFGDRYNAINFGFERTLVGFMGGRADLGMVAEYMYDDRGDDAVTTLFEHDLALGTRWSLNDVADTQALVGVIWDVQTDEYVFKLEGSRRLGETWTLLLEGRIFGGANEPDSDAPLRSLQDADNKSASLQRDDFLQLELTRYF
ncbi:MAG: SPOR domain-containing protein [Gammaproteobacteria bacterium]|nr:SPOR domain-containing protein [Gammaproteobacteria bacterium]